MLATSILMETKTSHLLHWLLLQYPDTPKSRAKQWILAGRVSVNGVILPKPTTTHGGSRRQTKTGRTPCDRLGVRFRVADSSARHVALPGFRRRHRQQGAWPCLGAGVELCHFGPQHPRRLFGGKIPCSGPQGSWPITAARLSPAPSLRACLRNQFVVL